MFCTTVQHWFTMHIIGQVVTKVQRLRYPKGWPLGAWIYHVLQDHHMQVNQRKWKLCFTTWPNYLPALKSVQHINYTQKNIYILIMIMLYVNEHRRWDRSIFWHSKRSVNRKTLNIVVFISQSRGKYWAYICLYFTRRKRKRDGLGFCFVLIMCMFLRDMCALTIS